LIKEVQRQMDLGCGTDSASWSDETGNVNIDEAQGKVYIAAISFSLFNTFPFLNLMALFVDKEHMALLGNII
ncbi:hypothetical protein CROQUDRAFT_26660, partial [Cronartium quercuum f. sp. fusiforme G11]